MYIGYQLDRVSNAMHRTDTIGVLPSVEVIFFMTNAGHDHGAPSAD